MFSAVNISLGNLSKREKIIYFSLVSIRTLSGILDIAGIAAFGLLAALASSSFTGVVGASAFGIIFPEVTTTTLVYIAGFALLFFVLKSSISIWVTRKTAFYLSNLESRLSEQIARGLFGKDLLTSQKYSRAEVSWILLDSSSHAFSGILLNFSSLISDGFLILLIATVFCVVNLSAAVASIAYLLFVVGLIQYWLHRRLIKAGENNSSGTMGADQVIEDMTSAYKEISVYKIRDFYFQKFRNSRSNVSESIATMRFIGGLPRQLMETALIFGIVIFIGWQLSSDSLEEGMGILGLFLAGGLRIVGSLIPFQGSLSNLKNEAIEASAAQNALDFVKNNVESNPRTHDKQLNIQQDAKTIIEFSNVTLTYPSNKIPVITDLSLTVDKGKRVALIGPSGAGKTTIADLLLGLVIPTSGEIVVVDNSFDQTEKLKISYVPQKPGIVSGTFSENIAFGINPTQVDLEQLSRVVEQVGLTELVNSWPTGVNTTIGSGGLQLSGGQLQRIGLARALYFSPDILVLDEATSALDASSEAFISEAIMNMPSDVTVLVIAHRLSTIQAADEVFLLEDGKITASGTFKELRANNPLLEEYVSLMSFDPPSS